METTAFAASDAHILMFPDYNDLQLLFSGLLFLEFLTVSFIYKNNQIDGQSLPIRESLGTRNVKEVYLVLFLTMLQKPVSAPQLSPLLFLWSKGHPETVLPRDSPYKQSRNPNTTMDYKKCIPKGICHGCLWRGPARALQIQRQMLAANHWSGCGLAPPMEELEGFTAPWKEQWFWPPRCSRTPRG